MRPDTNGPGLNKPDTDDLRLTRLNIDKPGLRIHAIDVFELKKPDTDYSRLTIHSIQMITDSMGLTRATLDSWNPIRMTPGSENSTETTPDI